MGKAAVPLWSGASLCVNVCVRADTSVRKYEQNASIPDQSQQHDKCFHLAARLSMQALLMAYISSLEKSERIQIPVKKSSQPVSEEGGGQKNTHKYQQF